MTKRTEMRSLADVAYVAIQERIIRGELPPGERLRERTFSEEFGVSRIPIREAFQRLENEGFVHGEHNRGIVVSALTRKDVGELFDLRMSLEVLASRLAARAAAEGAPTTQLRGLVDEARSALEAGDEATLAATNSQIHDEILRLSDSTLLNRLMMTVSAQTRRLFFFAKARNQPSIHAEHVEICSAIVSGHSELAEALTFAHVERSRLETLPLLTENGEANAERELSDRFV